MNTSTTGEEILDFIKTAELKGIKPGMLVTEVIEKLGNPGENIGDGQVGYLLYGIFSFGYFGDKIDELAVRFYSDPQVGFVLKENDLGEVLVINGNTKINEFIYILNTNGVLWDCYNKGDCDYFYVRSEKGVGVVFDLYAGTLNRISCVQV